MAREEVRPDRLELVLRNLDQLVGCQVNVVLDARPAELQVGGDGDGDVPLDVVIDFVGTKDSLAVCSDRPGPWGPGGGQRPGRRAGHAGGLPGAAQLDMAGQKTLHLAVLAALRALDLVEQLVGAPAIP